LRSTPQLGKRLRYFNFWSLRVGDYRVIYEIWKKERQIVVLFIGHRKHVYEDLGKLFSFFSLP
jgi:mRNA-degrading endonuclease RelE of RelBE toxin-antitoxin system